MAQTCETCRYEERDIDDPICSSCFATCEGYSNWAQAAPTQTTPPTKKFHLPEDDAIRALYPMADGCLDYFPNALAEVSRISYEGSAKHNPGQPMYWNRAKSHDHRNKVIRHTVETKDDSEASIEHAAQAAWRALAQLQVMIERVRGAPMAPGARPE